MFHLYHSAHDANAVFTLVNILGSILNDQRFKTLGNKKRFDYSILKQATILMFDMDNCLAVAKFLKFYYENLHLMNFDHVAEITLYLISEKFFEFFFHWSWHVRNTFYHIILYKVNNQIRLSDLVSRNTSGGRRKSLENSKEPSNYSVMV